MASKKVVETQAPPVIESFDSPESKLILGAIYDSGSQELRVTFRHTGFTYLYTGIAPALWTEFTTAASKGSFFGKAIRPVYAGKKVEG